MSREDPDIVEAMHRILSEEGIQFVLSAEPVAVQGRSGEGVSLTARTPAGAQTIEASDILVAIGRIPNTAGIGLDTAGVALDARGYIRVNDRLETTAPDVWAIGDCAGSPQFTHVSVDDFRIIRDNLAGGARSTDDRLVPYCVFTDPPLAHIGLSERDAQRQGIAVRVGKLPMSAVLPAGSDRRDTRLHESPCRRKRRPHSRLHDDRRRCGRGHGRDTDGDAGGAAVPEAS